MSYVDAIYDKKSDKVLVVERVDGKRIQRVFRPNYEFYYDDLIGLQAELVDGTPFGTIHWVLDAGAGVSLEIQTADGTVLVPFTKAAVPVVSVTEGKVVIDPPDGLLEPPPPEAAQDKN